MSNYALKFPIIKQFEFIDHFFFIQKRPGNNSRVLEHAEMIERRLFDYAHLKQVHSGKVFHFDEYPLHMVLGDGITTDKNGLWIGIHVADCAPLYLIDPEKRAIGTIHCGWRPIARDIVENAIALMSFRYGSNPRDIFAYIGPTIQVEDYEIGEEVAHHFDVKSLRRVGDKIHLDIPAEIVQRLTSLDLAEENIGYFPISTFREECFCSYRREGKDVKRMSAVMRIRPQ